jgi:hypothetical protein
MASVTQRSWRAPGQRTRGSQTFNRQDTARRYAYRAKLAHPSWSVEVIRHEGGEQTIVEEVKS